MELQEALSLAGIKITYSMKLPVFTRMVLGILLLGVLGTSSISAQACDAFFPMANNNAFEITYYNHKDKVQSVVYTTLTQKESSANRIVCTADAKISDGKGKEVSNSTYDMTCDNGEFRMDMRSMGNTAQMAGIENMEVTVESTDLIFPTQLTVGLELPDADMNLKAGMNGMTIMNLVVKVTNRKVTGEETITVPAGSFNCFIVEEDTETKMMGMNVKTHSKVWYSKGAGMIRTESYKDGKLDSYGVLSKLKV